MFILLAILGFALLQAGLVMAKYCNGPRAAVQEVPAASHAAGDVVIYGGMSYICDLDSPMFGTTIVPGALYIGGNYFVAADAAYNVGTYVYWNAAAKQVTTSPTGNLSFGWIVGGPNGLASEGGPTGAAGLCLVLHEPNGLVLPAAKFTTINVTTGTLAANAASGAAFVSLTSTNAAPGAQAMRTVAQVLADTPSLQIGQSYTLRITNTGAGTLTLTTDSGAQFTMTGTMTVPTNTFRDFIVTINTATTGTVQSIGTGTMS